MHFTQIITHPGGAHKDELLAAALLLAEHTVPLYRRDPLESELEDPETCVLDIGHQHEPARLNFDHHQFPRDHEPTCTLSLVLKHLGLYKDARAFCDWLEPAEWFDTRGPVETAQWLGMERETLAKLNSPIDLTLLRRFASQSELLPGDPLWEMLRMIGEDLLTYLRSLRQRLDFITDHAEVWDLGAHKILFLPRTDPLPEEPSMGIPRYIQNLENESTFIGMVYPDRRSSGYALNRYNDSPLLDFSVLEAQPDVHFAHARGFVAKTSATEQQRIQELLELGFQNP